MIEFRDDTPEHAPNSWRLVEQHFPDREEVREAMRRIIRAYMTDAKREFNTIPPGHLAAMEEHPYMALRVIHAHLYGPSASV